MPEDIKKTDAAEEQKEAETQKEPETEAQKPVEGEKKPMTAEAKKARRRKITKIILCCIGGLAAVSLLLLILVLIFIDPIVVFSVRQVGTYLTGTEVYVGDVDLSLHRGELQVTDFHVKNPEKYSDKKAIALGGLHVKLDPLSVCTKRIFVEDIHVKSLKVSCENGGQNLLAILDNIERKTGSKGKKKKKDEKPSETKVAIKHFKIEDSTLYLEVVPIPLNIELNDIGGESGSSWDELKDSCSKGWNTTSNSFKGTWDSLFGK